VAIHCPACHFKNPEDTHFCGKCGIKIDSSETEPKTHTETLKIPIKILRRGSVFADRYEVIEGLGMGGMGRVYKVYDRNTSEKIALKLINPKTSSDNETIERFSNELKIARKISHRNVCRMYDLGKVEGAHYITMEYVSGEDLKSMIKMSKQLSVSTAISIATQVCEGLSEAHRMGVVHRDLKPSNIMVDKNGNAKIMDFGIAQSLKTKGITGSDIVIGTPEYMSPEQVSGEDTDHRSDIYSMGVILYKMVTGKVPFEGDTALTIAFKHKTEQPIDPYKLNPHLSQELSNLILKCMEKDKNRRPQSAEELFLYLERLERPGLPSHAMSDWKYSVAVLPFKNMSADPEQEYFCDGMAEDIINSLTQIKDIRVVARTSAFSFKGKDRDIREIGRLLNVDKIVEGSVRKAGDRLRITAQLINVADGYHLWSDRFDREIEDVFAIQDEVTLAIVEKLKIRLFGKLKTRVFKHRLDDPEAYNLYLMGRYYLNKRTEDELHKSITYFEEMIENDPLSSLGYAGLADAYNSLGYFNFMSADEAYTKAKAAAEKALAMDKTLAEAHASLASVKMFYDWKLMEVEHEFRQAIRYNPSYVTAYHRLAFALSALGRHDEASHEINQARMLDPLSPAITTAAGWVFYLARQYDQAIELCKETQGMDPNFHVAHVVSGLALMEKGLLDESISAFEKALELEGRDIATLAYLGTACARAGRENASQKILQEMDMIARRKHVPSFYRAVLLTGMGKNEQALEWLEKSIEARIPWMIFLKVWPILDGLKSDPKFTDLLDRLGFKHSESSHT
jgi:serine/threonine-protein kinase